MKNEVIERLKAADSELASDGYKPYSYVRLAISQALNELSAVSINETLNCPNCKAELTLKVLPITNSDIIKALS